MTDRATSRSGAAPRPTVRRRWLYSALVALAVGALGEGALRLPWVTARLPPFDPSHGFAMDAGPFRVEGDVVSLVPDAARTFNPVHLARARAAGSIRVVVLGGSSTYGFPYGDAVSHPRFLEHRLRAALPGADVEVVNLGGMSYGTLRISRMLGWVLRLEPDLVIVDTGHNEFVERAAYERALGGGATGSATRAMLAGSRLFGLLAAGVERLGASGTGAGSYHSPFGLEVSRDENRIFTLEDKQRVALAFEDRLRDIVARCRDASVPVVLLTQGSNLRDWRPEYLAFAYSLPAERQREFLRHAALGLRLLDTDRAAEAIDELDRALAIDDRHASTVFQRATALARLGRTLEAVAAFRRARDLDPVPIRALGAMNDAIRRVAADTGSGLVDAEAALGGDAADGIPGGDQFLDYCHPTDRGHRVVATAVASSLAANVGVLPGIHGESAARLAAVADADHLPEEVAPPLDQLSPQVLWWLGTAARRQGRDDEAVARFELALARDPDNAPVLRSLAELLRGRRDYARARPLAERLAASPTATVADDLSLASVLLGLGEVEEARRRLLAAEQRSPDDATVQLMLGQVDRHGGRPAEARRHLERALAIRPDLYVARGELAEVCRALGDKPCAVRAYREILAQVHYSPAALEGLAELGEPPP